MNERKHIPVGECKRGHVYRIHSRNLSFGVFVPEKEDGFIGIRVKGGSPYLFTELHADTGGSFGTVYPEEDLGPLEDERILLTEHLPTTCEYCGERTESYPVDDESMPNGVRYLRRHISGDGSVCDDAQSVLNQNLLLYRALRGIEQRHGKGASIEYVFVLVQGNQDADGDGWYPDTQFSGVGNGGVRGVFKTRGALHAYVEDHPPRFDCGGHDYKADEWTRYSGRGAGTEPMWITGPVAPLGGRYIWLHTIKMRLKGDDYVW
jgi:hypothetical protein